MLAFGFNHAEAIRSFRAAQKLDPACAMCFWGEALATGPNINVTSKGKAIMSPEEQRAAWAALTKSSGAGQIETGKGAGTDHRACCALRRRAGGRP